MPQTKAALPLLGLLALLFFSPLVRANTLTVTSLADSGAGSLRDTIAASATGDVINFAVTDPITNFAVTDPITLTSGELPSATTSLSLAPPEASPSAATMPVASSMSPPGRLASPA